MLAGLTTPRTLFKLETDSGACMKKIIGPMLYALALNFAVTSTLANPLGGGVASGTAAITPAGSTLTIAQSSTTSIINFSSFNIANGETTLIQFPTANSAALVLVNVGNPSTIAGLFESTVGAGGPVGGTVIILNPSGVLFTPTAQVDLGSLTAATLGLPNQTE